MADRKTWIYLAAVLLCLLGTVLSLSLGAARLSLSELYQAICSGPNNTAGYIFWYTRLPRTAACLASGVALATAGCILQSVLGNKLASPGIIGVNAGAGLAVFGIVSDFEYAAVICNMLRENYPQVFIAKPV